MDNSLSKSDNSNELVIDKMTSFIVAKGLSSVAIFSLEIHKPLRGVFSLSHTALSPVLNMILGAKFNGALADILQTPEGVEMLIRKIEYLSGRSRC